MDKNERLKILGNNLRKFREQQGITQEKLAEKAGISTSFYANLERGNRGMSIFVLADLAQTLGVSIDSLLMEDNPDGRINNINTLLRNQLQSFIMTMESIIRLCIEEYRDSR